VSEGFQGGPPPVSRRYPRGRLPLVLVALAMLALSAWYLYDPPWLAGVTSGLLNWEEEDGRRFRWTVAHASFFVPGDASTITLPMRAWFPSNTGAIVVSVSVDDRWLANIELRHPRDWESSTLPLPRQKTYRRHRRVDLHISRVVPPFNLGVELGVVQFR
jgi:hypothetical protein